MGGGWWGDGQQLSVAVTVKLVVLQSLPLGFPGSFPLDDFISFTIQLADVDQQRLAVMLLLLLFSFASIATADGRRSFTPG
jgi:hypothetical protein